LQIQEIFDEAGIRGFWKGVLPSLIMVCWKWISFMLRSITKRLLFKSGKQSFHTVHAVW